MKAAIELPAEVFEAARRVARAEGLPLETSIARLIERRLRKLPPDPEIIPNARKADLDDWRQELL